MYTLIINLKSFDSFFLDKIEKYLNSIFSFFMISRVVSQSRPKKIKKFTVLRSPHIDKKSREQFQLVTYTKTVKVFFTNQNLLLAFLEILKDSKWRGAQVDIVLEYATW